MKAALVYMYHDLPIRVAKNSLAEFVEDLHTEHVVGYLITDLDQ